MKKKLNFIMLNDLLSTENNGYFNFNKVTYKNTYPGYMYTLEKSLSENLKNEILKYKNVILSESCYRYAPELKYNCIFLAEKCIKAV